MNVLLVNGSPHKNGCTHAALEEVGRALEGEGVHTDWFWIGNRLSPAAWAAATAPPTELATTRTG